MSDRFDLIVLGAGSGGLAAAKRAASYGARVAIVEGDRVGGTCVIRGCVPKKLLVYGSAYHHLLADAPHYGWSLGAVRCDPATLLANVRAEVDRLNALHIGFLEKAGVQLVRGWGRFSGPESVQVVGAEGCRELRAERILIAVGGRPHRPSFPGAERAWVSDDLFELQRLPESIVVVGAGFIACEFAGILAGLGVRVTQLVRGDHLLRGFDREASRAVQEGMEAAGIRLLFGDAPAALEAGTPPQAPAAAPSLPDAAAGAPPPSTVPQPLTLTTESGEAIACEGVLLATGRRPFLEGLNLEAVGVATEGQRIPVDADQRTNVPSIFAVGDVTDRLCLTPVAIDEGRAFADSVYGNRPRRVDHSLVASAVFSQPELAGVGLSEEQAIERHGAEAIRVHRARFRPMSQALPARDPKVLLKLIVEQASGRVLGVHMVGEHAAEIIQMAAIPLGMGATKADFDRTMALHPSVAEEFVTLPN